MNSRERAASRDELRNIRLTAVSQQQKGFIFERWLQRELVALGLADAKWLGGYSGTPYDIVSESEPVRIQAKYSERKGDSFDVSPVRPVAGSTLRLYRVTDFDVLAVYYSQIDELYFVATKFFESSEHPGMIRGRFNRKRMAQCLEDWGAVFRGGQDGPADKQLKLAFA